LLHPQAHAEGERHEHRRKRDHGDRAEAVAHNLEQALQAVDTFTYQL
jgi:hypothetical protein